MSNPGVYGHQEAAGNRVIPFVYVEHGRIQAVVIGAIHRQLQPEWDGKAIQPFCHLPHQLHSASAAHGPVKPHQTVVFQILFGGIPKREK